MRSGDVLRIDVGIPVGSTPALVQPAVVVTSDPTLAIYTSTFHAVPLTTNVGRAWASDVPLDVSILESDSAAQCHLLAVVDRGQVIDDDLDDLGNVGSIALAQIRKVIATILDLPV